ncbi:unnamed protein product [Rhizophagus irregularis]|nr:unnamed protein product [Rhizophagus irregularis]
MLLTTLLDPAPTFPIRIKYNSTGSVYVANVATYTDGEVLLNSFQNCVGPNGINMSCKLVYLEPADTLEELGIKEEDLVEAVTSEYENPISLTKFESTPTKATKARSSMLIYVKTHTGITKLKVHWNDTIIQIKGMIQDLEGISFDKHCIIFDGIRLEDCCTLSYYNIQKESTLHLKSIELIIYVETETGETIKLELTENDFISQVKLMIQDKKGILPDLQCITFNNFELQDYNTLLYYYISNNDILYLIIKPMIYVKFKTGKIINLKIATNETVKQIKQKIKDKEDITPSQQRLIFADNELHDQNTLSYYNIREGSTVHLEYKEIKLYVIIMNEKIIELKIRGDHEIKTVKQMIQDKEGIPSDQHYLYLAKNSHNIPNLRLYNWDSLSRRNINNESILHLSQQFLLFSGQVFVKTVTGKTITLEAASSDHWSKWDDLHEVYCP